METNRSTNTTEELDNPLLPLLSVSVSLAILALMIAAMRATAPNTSMTTLLVILGHAGVVFWIALAVLLHIVATPDDQTRESPAFTTRFVRAIVCLFVVPAAACLGGALSPHPWIGWTFGVFFSLMLQCFICLPSPSKAETPTNVLRGTVVLSLDDARKRLKVITRPLELLINWVGLLIPERYSEQHFLVVGATGSGKTVVLRLLMQSVLPRITRGSNWRAVIYDAKQDMMEILSGLPLSCDVILLNPFDARSAAWDMAKDITTHATAVQIASIFIAEEKGDNSFFAKAARDLFAAVLFALHETQPGDWTLANVVAILSSRDRAKDLLERVPYTRYMAEEYFSRDEKTLANIQSTVSANIGYLRPIASLWHHARRRISLTEWVKSESILVLGNMEHLRCPLDAVNRALFQRLAELVLTESESTTRRTWFFLDELKEAGKHDALPRLLTEGRSKGVRIAMGFQTIEGLEAVYGDRLASEITGIAANKCLLRTDSHKTAEWASYAIGETEYRAWTRSKDPQGYQSISEQIVKREAVIASQLQRLPLANRKRLYGYCITPCIGVYAGVTPFGHMLRPKGPGMNFVPRPDQEQNLPMELFDTEDVCEPCLDDVVRVRDRRRWVTADEDIEARP